MKDFFNPYSHGFVRLAVATPLVRLGDPQYNVDATAELMQRAAKEKVLLAVFPELGLSAYSCDDLFHQQTLIDAAEAGLQALMQRTRTLALAALVGLFGTALVQLVPLDVLRLVIGAILILFGLKWLKKAILRYAGLKALHDEEAIFEQEQAAIRARGAQLPQALNKFGVALAFKSVLLEGLEVAFIVITFGVSAARGEAEKSAGLASATAGALAALLVVIVVGALAHAPLRRVPENTLKFIVGVMLTTFGTFWAGEGLGVEWFAGDLALLALVAAYVFLSWLLVAWLRRYAHASTMERTARV